MPAKNEAETAKDKTSQYKYNQRSHSRTRLVGGFFNAT